jgi:PhnB protein
MISDEAPDLGALSPTTLGGAGVAFALDVADADAAFQRAVDAGAKVDRLPKDEPYGRAGWIIDPFGFRWNIATVNPDFKPEDML